MAIVVGKGHSIVKHDFKIEKVADNVFLATDLRDKSVSSVSMPQPASAAGEIARVKDRYKRNIERLEAMEAFIEDYRQKYPIG